MRLLLKIFLEIVLISSFCYVIFIPYKHAKAADLTACGTLNASGTYVLQNDVTSTGTCFVIGASNIVLDLNGHTVTFNTSGADNKYAFADIDDAGNVQWNKNGVRITNGSLVQSSACQVGNCYSNFAVYFREVGSVEADHLTISYQGDNNVGINADGGSGKSNANVHDNIIRPNGTKRNAAGVNYPTHYGDFAAIVVGSTCGVINVSNNDIQGKGYQGIHTGYSCPVTSMTVNSNTIKMASAVRDGYAIVMNSPNNDSFNFEFAYNTIIQTNGRGIMAEGNLSDSSPGPGGGKIHDNNIEVRESHDSGEYNAAGTALGITLRFGAHDIKVYNNTILGHAGANACPPSFPGQKADCSTYGIKVAGQNGVHNEIYNNTITVDTSDANYPAGGFYGDSGQAAPAATYNAYIHHNTVTSNSYIVSNSADDGSGSFQIYESNTFIKGANPLSFHSINAAYWIGSSIENVFLDNDWQNGATKDDVRIEGVGDSVGCLAKGNTLDQCWNYSLYTKWYLDVTVKNEGGQPVSGANVSAVATGGASETVTGTTDASGKTRLALTEYKRWGKTYPQSTNYDHYSPHTITVIGNGTTKTATVTMDHSQVLDVVLGPASLTLIKQADKTTAVSGENITYSISFTVGSSAVTNAVISDNIPQGTSYLSSSNGGSYDEIAKKVSWELPLNLDPNSAGQVQLVVKVL